MKCPQCHNKTQVTETRAKTSYILRRRRECLKCQYRFTTYERIVPLKIAVQKRNGRIEPFQQKKLKQGIAKALTKRPINKEEFTDLVEQIKDTIRQKKKKIISSKEIGKIVMENLKKVDEVAYLRFASVYRGFGSSKSFVKEIKNLKK